MARSEIQNKALVVRFADKYGVKHDEILTILKQTAFHQTDGSEVSNAQMCALLVVADQYGLNPFTREIYAFPDKKSGGVVPVVPVDGWIKITTNNPKYNGMEIINAEDWSTYKNLEGAKACPDYMEVIIYRKDREKSPPIREYLDEVYRPPFKGTKNNKPYVINGPWQTHTKRMLRHKTIIQAARVIMGFGGIYDEDEAARIVEAQVMETKQLEPSKPRVDMPVESTPGNDAPEICEPEGMPFDLEEKNQNDV